MAASDHLNEQQFYHASAHPFSPGDTVTPGHQANYQARPESHVYFSDTPDRAWHWADDIQRETGMETDVYRVQPTGAYKPDPFDEDARGDYRSPHALRILGRA